MSIYRRNGTVFSAGSTDWVDTLTGQPQYPLDPSVIAITKNVVNRLSTRIAADWEHVGHANDGSAMTAVGTRLFLATAANRLWRRHPVAADVPWREVGHADSVVALASDGDVLYGLTATDQLWWRPAIETDINWQRDGRRQSAVPAPWHSPADCSTQPTPPARSHRRPATHARRSAVATTRPATSLVHRARLVRRHPVRHDHRRSPAPHEQGPHRRKHGLGRHPSLLLLDRPGCRRRVTVRGHQREQAVVARSPRTSTTMTDQGRAAVDLTVARCGVWPRDQGPAIQVGR